MFNFSFSIVVFKFFTTLQVFNFSQPFKCLIFHFLLFFSLPECSVLGGILLVGSLYCVLWGKRKEEELKRLSIQGALKAEVEQHI